MNNWQAKKLGDITVINGGGTPPTSHAEYFNGDVPWFTPSEITSGTVSVLTNSQRQITEEATKFSKVAEQGTVLLSSRATIGNIGIVANRSTYNQGIKGITPKEDLNSWFLAYWLLANKKGLEKSSFGTTFKELSTTALKKFDITIPPISVQQKIVERLDSIRKLQELNQKEIEKAEELFDSLLSVKFYPNKAYKRLNFEDVVTFKRGPFGGSLKKEIFVSDGFRVYEQRNAIYDDFTNCRYFITEEKYKEMIGFAVKTGDLIVSCSGTIGKVALVPNKVSPGIINQALLKITPKIDIVLSEYLKYLIQSRDMQIKMFGNARGSSIKNIVSIKEIKKLVLSLPSIKEQQQIVKELDFVANIHETKILLKKSISQIYENSLIKAMKGEMV